MNLVISEFFFAILSQVFFFYISNNFEKLKKNTNIEEYLVLVYIFLKMHSYTHFSLK